ncbi:hypothetical protein FB451DRAFT_1438888 [Mycena latifolia]|nr:hypothetical protein FB451DRAFT_1438888 [Mycena latifolia]
MIGHQTGWAALRRLRRLRIIVLTLFKETWTSDSERGSTDIGKTRYRKAKIEVQTERTARLGAEERLHATQADIEDLQHMRTNDREELREDCQVFAESVMAFSTKNSDTDPVKTASGSDVWVVLIFYYWDWHLSGRPQGHPYAPASPAVEPPSKCTRHEDSHTEHTAKRPTSESPSTAHARRRCSPRQPRLQYVIRQTSNPSQPRWTSWAITVRVSLSPGTYHLPHPYSLRSKTSASNTCDASRSLRHNPARGLASGKTTGASNANKRARDSHTGAESDSSVEWNESYER